MSTVEFRPPASPEEYDDLYNLCYRVLLKPWGHPSGIEREVLPATETHLVCIVDGVMVATCRLDRISETLGQVRFVAVDDSVQGKGYGRQLMLEVETEAKRRGMTELMLHSRQNAVMFYHHLGYNFTTSPTFVWHTITHHGMQKSLVQVSNQVDMDLYAALKAIFAAKETTETSTALVEIFLADVMKKHQQQSERAKQSD